MEKLVNTLNDFHAQTHPLDLNHQNAVIALRDAVMSLFEASPPFQGKAAESLFNLLLDYLKVELSFTGAQGDTSPKLASATSSSQKTADLIYQHLQTLYAKSDDYAYTLDQDRNVPELLRPAARAFNPDFPSDATLAAACALPPGAIQLVQDMEYDESDWGRQMNGLGEEPPPPLPPEPTDAKVFLAPPGSSFFPNLPMNSLTDVQRRTVADVIAELSAAGITYDQREIEDLVRAGYGRDTIEAIITRGMVALFQGADVAKMMGELTGAQQLKFIGLVEQYQKAHSGFTSHQVYNYLRFTQMLAQANQLRQDIINSPINNAAYHEAMQRFLMRLNRDLLTPMQNALDPFLITDNQLGEDGGGWKSYLVGIEGEWGVIQHYYYESLTNPNVKLVNFSVPYVNPQQGETDIIIEENGVVKWVEVKNYRNLRMRTGKWQKLRDQVIGAIAEGSTNIIVDLPQGVPGDIARNLIRLGQDRGVTVTVQSTGGIPYEPPVPPDWGKMLPIPRT